MLVIIDCQKQFPAVEYVIDPVVKEVEKAKRRNEWVMLVTTNGRTVTRIAKHLADYRKVVKVTKDYDDGSPVIFERLYAHYWRRSHRLSDKHIGEIRSMRVVGVNTSACVMKTVNGLRRFARVTVIAKACANSSDMRLKFSPEVHHRGALRRMNTWANVGVVE